MARGIDTPGFERCPVHDPQLERWQITSPWRKDYLAGYSLERQSLAVYLHEQTCLQEHGLAVQIPAQARMPSLWGDAALLDLRERRDLRHIEQVAQLNAILGNAQTGIATDAKIAQRMRQARRWNHEICTMHHKQHGTQSGHAESTMAHRIAPHPARWCFSHDLQKMVAGDDRLSRHARQAHGDAAPSDRQPASARQHGRQSPSPG